MPIKIFSGSANPQLAVDVSKILNIPLSWSEVVRFDNSEVRVAIKEKVKDAACIVIQSLSNPTDTNLMELFFFADALKRNRAKEISAIIPYFGYARQNREHSPGEAVSINVIIRFIEVIGFNAVYTISLHDEATEGIFSITFKNLNGFEVLTKRLVDYLKKNKYPEDVAIVSPDQGGVERAQNFADNFFHTNNVDVVVVEKKRDLGKIHQSKAINIFGEVKNKTCVIVDDIITSGGTLINAAHLCLKKGAKRVLACIVHHDLSPSALKILSDKNLPLEKIFTTNTIALKPDQKLPLLEEVSVAPLIAKYLPY